MGNDADIWDQHGRLTLAAVHQDSAIDLPPLPKEGDEQVPLRILLRRFLDAPASLRGRFSLQLENGQTYNEQDISELLSRDDCPVR